MHKSIIFTDLDGTLLDSDSYRWEAAAPALQLIAELAIPLIFCSSKTRAEIEVLRAQLHNQHPFIVENGGGIYIPHGYFSTLTNAETSDGYHSIPLGRQYRDVRQHFEALRSQLGARVRGFADMSLDEIARLTGLNLAAAALARQRDFEEPFVFDGPMDEGFLSAILESGLTWTRGSMFHIMGQHDKGRAVNLLKTLYAAEYGSITSIALGDSLNDLPMLEAVDYPVLIPHKDEQYDAQVSLPGLLRSNTPGPEGWNEMLLQLLPQERNAELQQSYGG